MEHRKVICEIVDRKVNYHMSTCAGFNPSDPLDSGIVLEDSILTAREIMKIGAQPELLTLSTCETGITGNFANL